METFTGQITPDCLCVHRKKPYSEPISYPLWKEGEDNAAKLRKNGYFVVRGLLTNQEVEETKTEISRVVSGWYESQAQKVEKDGTDWEEIANRLPEVKEGKKVAPSDPELAIRRLFRMAVHNQYFRDLSKHPKIVSVISEQLGPDVKLLQSMSLLKPPGSGEKKWHQDNAYFRLTPCKVIGCWIAIDPANCSNGCMHLLPGSHGGGVFKHAAPLEFHIDYGMVDLPNADDVISIVLSPGDALVFHGETAHYTPPNVSEIRRRSVQFHYASSECKPTKCPKKSEDEEKEKAHQIPSDEDKPHYFDCDPSCQEPEYWYYRKAEILVCGRDFGGEHI